MIFQLKYKELRPDKGIITVLDSIKQNPKFKRLLNFQLNALVGFLTPPNPKHRENAMYVIQGEVNQKQLHQNIILALENHSSDDSIVLNSAHVLEKLIGQGNYRNEDIIQLLVEGNVMKGINSTLSNPEYAKSKESMKQLLNLINVFIVNPAIANKFIEQNTLECLMSCIKSDNIEDTSQISGLETLNNFLNYPIVLQKVVLKGIVPQFCETLFDCILSTSSVSLGFKFIQKMIQTKEGLEYVKKCGIIKTIVSIMSCFSNDKSITNIGSYILSKIINENTISNALRDLKQQSGDLTFQSALLSNLVLASEQMEELIEKGDVLKEVLNLVKQFKDKVEDSNIDVLKNCFITLARIANLNSKQAKNLVNQGGIEILSDFIENDNPQILISLIETFQLLLNSYEGAFEIIKKKGIIKTIIDFANTVHSENVLVGRSISNFLSIIVNQSQGASYIIQNNGIFLLIKIFKAGKKYKTIVETVIRILSQLAEDKSSAKSLGQKLFIEQIIEICNDHPQWRKYCYHSVKCISSLIGHNSSLIDTLKNLEIVETLISIINKKAYVILLNSEGQQDDQDDDDDDQADQDYDDNAVYDQSDLEELVKMKKENKEIEEFSEKLECNIIKGSKDILSHVITIDDVMSVSEQIEGLYQELTSMSELHKQLEYSILLEMSIIKLGLGISILPRDSLDMSVHSICLTISKTLIEDLESLPNNENENQEIVIAMNLFYLYTSELFENNETQSQYNAFRFIDTFIELSAKILNKFSRTTLRQHLKCLLHIIKRVNPNKPQLHIIRSQQSSKSNKQQTQPEIKMMKNIINVMRKNIEDFELLSLSLDNLVVLCQQGGKHSQQGGNQPSQEDLIANILVEEGALKFIVSNLELFIDVELGVKCLSFLEITLKQSEQIVADHLCKLKTLPILMNYIVSMNNAVSLRQAAQEILQILSNFSEQDIGKNEGESSTVGQSSPLKQQQQQQQQQHLGSNLAISSPIKRLALPTELTSNLQLISEGGLLEEDFKQLIIGIDPESPLKEFSLHKGSCALETITNYALIDRNLEQMLGLDIVLALNNLIGYIIIQDENELAISGNLFVSERLLVGSLQIVIRILQSSVTQKEKALNQMIDSLFIQKILSLLKLKQHSVLIVLNTTVAFEELLKEEVLRDETLTLVNEQNLCEFLFVLLEKMNSLEETEVSQSLYRLIFNLAQISPQSSNQLGNKDFVKSILRKIKVLMTSDSSKIQSQLSENVKCLLTLAESQKTQEIILNENGLECLFMIIKNQNTQSSEEKIETIISDVCNIIVKMSSAKSFEAFLSDEFFAIIIQALGKNVQASKQISYSFLLVLNKLVKLCKKSIAQLTALNADDIIQNIQIEHSSDRQIKQLCNDLLQNFKTDNTIISNKQLVSSVKLDDPDILKKIQKLSNTYNGFIPQDKQSVLKPNKQLIQQILVLLKSKDKDIIKATLTLIASLSQESTETKSEILESDIPNIIIESIIQQNKNDNSIILLCFEALNANLSIFNQMNQFSFKILDIETTTELFNTSSIKELNNLKKLFSNASLYTFCTDLIEKQSAQIAERVLEFLSLSVQCSPSNILIKNDKFLTTLEGLADKVSESDFFNIYSSICQVLSSVVRNEDAFEYIINSELIKTVFKNSNIQSISALEKNEKILHKSSFLTFLYYLLELISRLSENEFDKTVMIQLNIVENIIALVKKLLNSQSEFADPYSLKILKQLFECIKTIEKDRSTARVVSSLSGEKIFISLCQKIVNQIKSFSNLLTQKNIAEKASIKQIEGSLLIQEQVVESIVLAIHAITSNKSQIESLEPFKSKSNLNKLFKQLITERYENVLVVAKVVNTIEMCMKYYNKDALLSQMDEIKQFQPLITSIKKIYTSIPCIQQSCSNILAVASGTDPRDLKYVEENTRRLTIDQKQNSVANKTEPLPQKTEASISIDLSAYASKPHLTITEISALLKQFESFAIKPQSKEELLLLETLHSSVSNFCKNIEKAQQLQNIGLAESLVDLVKDQDNSRIDIIFKTLNYMYSYPKVVQKSKVVSSVITIVSKYLTKLVTGTEMKNFQKYKEGLKYSTLILSYAGPFPAALLLIYQTKIVQNLVDLIRQTYENEHKDSATQCLETLAKICSSKQISQQFLENGGNTLLEKILSTKNTEENLLIASCYVLGKASQNSLIQSKFFQIAPLVVEKMNAYKDNTLIFSKACFALASMVFNNEKHSIEILKKNPTLLDSMIQISSAFVETENDLLSNVCMLLNSLCFKNTEAKQIVGTSNAIQLLIKITSSSTILDATIQQALKTIGNLSLLESNSLKIVQTGLMSSVASLIKSKIISNKELCTFSLEILLNVCAVIKKVESKEDNYKTLITQHFFQVVFEYIHYFFIFKPVNLIHYQYIINSCIVMKEDIQKIIIETICCTIQSDCMSQEFTKLNGIQIIIKILSENEIEIPIQINLLRILQYLSSTSQSQCTQIMIKSNIQNILFESINKAKDSKFISKAFKILFNLLQNPNNLKSIVSDKKLEVFLYTFEPSQIEQNLLTLNIPFLNVIFNQKSNSAFKDYLSFLDCFSTNDQIFIIISKKQLYSAIAALQDRLENIELVEQSLELIEKIALNKQTVEKLADISVLSYLSLVLKRLLAKQQITQKVLRCLEIISSTNEANRQVIADATNSLFEKLLKETQKVPEIFKMIQNANKSIQKGTSIATRQSLITSELKEFVLNGTIARLYKENGTSSKLKIFVTNDLMEFNCRKETKTQVKSKWKISINMIQQIKSNFDTDSVAYSKSHFAISFRKKAEPETCFAIIGPPQSTGRKCFYVQCGSQFEKEKWVQYLNDLLQEAQEYKKTLQVMF